METESKKRELKHLGFVRMAAIQAVVCVSSLYECAKRNAGPLKSTVGTVENAVTTVVSPVYEKFKGVPDEVLGFVDKKVDEASGKFDEHAPPLVKQVVNQAQVVVHKASEKARTFVDQARNGGPRAALRYAAGEYKQLVLSSSVKLWVKLNEYKPVHSVAEKALPVAANMSKKYNDVLKEMTQKGYSIVGYLPPIPVNDIAKAFKDESEAAKKGDAAGHKSDSDSDSE